MVRKLFIHIKMAKKRVFFPRDGSVELTLLKFSKELVHNSFAHTIQTINRSLK